MPDLMQVAPPAEAWSYNNAGFSVAGRLIETLHRALGPQHTATLPAPAPGRWTVRVRELASGLTAVAGWVAGLIGGLDIEVDGVAEGTRIVSGPVQTLRELTDGARITPRP